MDKRLEAIKVFVLDMDGTVYLGNNVIDGAVQFVENARAMGKRVLFFTNNASRNKEIYMTRLTKMGFAPAQGDILTSGDVTADFLVTNRKGKKVFVLGTPALREALASAGVELTDGLDADIVLTSFDTTLVYDALNTACRLIREGKEYLSTHGDINCPTEYGFMPDSGAINACITASTGCAPRYFGKPERETAEMICRYTGYSGDAVACVGDRLYTDIALGRLHGLTSILVLTGETALKDVNDSNSPDFVFDSIADIPLK